MRKERKELRVERRSSYWKIMKIRDWIDIIDKKKRRRKKKKKKEKVDGWM